MDTKQLQLVTFEQAEKLKSLGFDWWTHKVFYKETGRLSNHATGCINGDDTAIRYGHLSAPAVALALKWMRDEKGLYGYCDRTPTGWHLKIYRTDGSITTYNFNYRDRERLDPHEAAESALLDELLTLLEKEKINENN